MTKRVQAKNKICRRLGVNLWGRAKNPIVKRDYPPGEHGSKRRKISGFGQQLAAKQKLRGYYANLSERQFRRIYQEASRLRGDTAENMIGLLERRLDIVVYRMNFVPTVFAARQFVNHGHVKVNGRRVNIPSYRVKVGDTIEVKDASKQMTLVLEAQSLAERDVPDYIEVNEGQKSAKLTRIPVLSDVPYAVMMEPHLIVEYYSR